MAAKDIFWFGDSLVHLYHTNPMFSIRLLRIEYVYCILYIIAIWQFRSCNSWPIYVVLQSSPVLYHSPKDIWLPLCVKLYRTTNHI